jgi:hypothetical protein
MSDQVQIEIALKTLEAVQELNKFSKTLAETTKKGEKDTKEFGGNLKDSLAKSVQSFGGLKTAATAALAAFGAFKLAKSLVNQFSEGLRGAQADTKALQALSQQLNLKGIADADTIKSFTDLASELEKTTNTGADLVLQQASLTTAFGLSAKESQDLIRAATELSAITGDSLQSSVDNLTKTYLGQGRAVSQTISAVAGLTKEQLRNGDAIKLINEQYGGTAAKAALTYEGQLKNLGRAYGDIFKNTAANLVNNDSVIASFKALADTIDEFSGALSDPAISEAIESTLQGFLSFGRVVLEVLAGLEQGFNVFVGAVLKVPEAFTKVASVVTKQISRFTGFGKAVADATESANEFVGSISNNLIQGGLKGNTALSKLTKVVDQAGERFDKTKKQIAETGKQYSKTAGEIAKRPLVPPEQIEKAKEQFKSFTESLTSSVATETEKINLERDKQLRKLEELGKQGGIAAKDLADARLLIEQKFSNDVAALQVKQDQDRRAAEQKSLDDLRRNINEQQQLVRAAFEDPISATVQLFVDPKTIASLDLGLSTATKQMIAAFSGLATQILDGAKGASKFLEQGIAAGVDFFAPGLGQVIGPLAGKLAEMTPEQIKKQVQEFAKQVPVLIEALAEGIPVFVETFLDVMINRGGALRIAIAIVKGIANAFADILLNTIDFLGKALTGAFKSIAGFLGSLFSKIFTDSFSGVKNFFSSIFTAISKVFDPIVQFFEGIIEFFKDPLKSIREAAGSAVSGVGSFFGFAQGGIVPGGFPNDSFPARLTSGEMILPPDISSGLRDLISRGGLGGGGRDSDDIMVGLLSQMLDRISQPIEVETSLEFRGQTFADIILQLNRNNARLAV